jgi:hypothetical protein
VNAPGRPYLVALVIAVPIRSVALTLQLFLPPDCARERADSQFDSRADELRGSTANVDGMIGAEKT